MSDAFTGLKICHWNANGIYSKLTDFKNFVHNHNADVILLQGLMLKPTENIFILIITSFVMTVHKNPVSGGTAILIKSNISHHCRSSTPSLKSIKTTIISVHPSTVSLKSSLRTRHQICHWHHIPKAFDRKVSYFHQIKLLLYKVYLRPLITYACPVWGSAAKSNIAILAACRK
ncbi:hypothetical protein CEXT_142131 [Caerostris extrusa]|uniref:Endonuclease/exonuclease/phosphatase domain-containing protein n=1 Tax=Caerostris extrusa TaxID=172846 RepID=A0AAV4M5K1_CAEEX|nr:hypothetical protein CEXT_142131 [Caerostris extrusa]